VLWLSVVIVAAVFVALGYLVIRSRPKPELLETYPYTKNENPFSASEHSFFATLDQAVGDRFKILGKICIADIAVLKKLSDRSARKRAQDRIAGRHFDYIICSRHDLSVVAAISLDDKSCDHPDRKERDTFIEGLCDAMSLPFFRFYAGDEHAVPEIRSKILKKLRIDDKPQNEPGSENSQDLPSEDTRFADEEIQREFIEEETDVFNLEEVTPLCPVCSAPMTARIMEVSPNEKKEFWCCINHPECRGMLPKDF